MTRTQLLVALLLLAPVAGRAQTTTTTMTVKDGTGASQTLRVDKNADGSLATHNVDEVGGAAVSPSNPKPTQDANDGAAGTGIAQPTGGSGILGWLSGIYNRLAPLGLPITPTGPSGNLTLAAGGAAQSLAMAGSATHGCQLYNPATAAQQGIATAESAFVNYTGASATTSAGGQSFEILPGASWNCPLGMTTGISWNANTTGHKITGAVW